MRDLQDLLQLRFHLVSSIGLDWERIESDPVWQQVSANYDLSLAIGREDALRQYVGHYISRDRFLANMPSTNGPGDVWLIRMEVIHGKPSDQPTDPEPSS